MYLENLEYLQIKNSKRIFRNLSAADLTEAAVKRGEAVLSDKGALVIHTGKYTGRSPKDRFIVRQKSVEANINWGSVNVPIEEDTFDCLYNQVTDYLKEKELYVFDGHVGAANEYRMPIRVVCELASQALFANQLFRRPTKPQLEDFQPEFTVISAPGFKAKGKEDGIILRLLSY